jgi:hypothetical protein
MTICIDFDGTCVSHEFPEIGHDIGAVPVLRKLVENGHRLILFTMRSDIDHVTSNDYDIHGQPGKYLTEALKWFEDHGISLWGINTNPDQHTWTHSPKAYGHLYIDDAALGVPLKVNTKLSKKPFVDWKRVEINLRLKGLIN